MAKDQETQYHQEWIGYVQPVGLVVSFPALVAAQAFLNRNIIPEHDQFLECVEEVTLDTQRDLVLAVTDLPGLLCNVFGWEPQDLVGGAAGDPLPDSLDVVLPEYGETLRPTYAVREVEPRDGGRPWLMLIRTIKTGTDLDEIAEKDVHRWNASPHARFERLLRENQVPIGLLCNGTHLRLVYAPRGETSGYATFPVKHMCETAGRSILAALHMLLSADRLFALPEKQRLPAILAESRKYQNLVSAKLAEQVLAALYELLRGFQAADEYQKGHLLGEVLQEDPNHVYAGLLTVLLRLVFTLYAEDRGLLSADPVYLNHYSVTGLFERLRSDAGQYPDSMDHRYGAWAQLLTLFRLIHDGGRHGSLRLPPRRGSLFDPDRFKFLEGRAWKAAGTAGDGTTPPMVSDGVVFRVLQNLLILDGERLSYRSLDVEQIGSVYETIMGFELQVAAGRSIAVKSKKAHGVPVTLNLDELLTVASKSRGKWLRDQTDHVLSGATLEALESAITSEGAVVALGGKVAKDATPGIVPPGAMILQPSEERRRSGSHYTPRSLTEPIVRTTLRPVLQRLGPNPTPEQILALKVCDLAMGSGAFLVETCRQLGDKLVKAWHAHGKLPTIPADEDEVLHARRLVAQSCLYGVDRNPMAVDLAKLSLWLATLAKDHPFTFLDHALRPGDSLVGLTKAQIAGFHWQPTAERVFGQERLEKKIERVSVFRREILDGGDWMLPSVKRQKLDLADEALKEVREAGNLVVAAFFGGDKDKKRIELRTQYLDRLAKVLRGDMAEALKLEKITAHLRSGNFPLTPFHWEIEFPEVFDRENPGFDAIVGNPPFAQKNTVVQSLGDLYLSFLLTMTTGSNGKSDLCGFFFRRAFDLLRKHGCFGLLATNTIGQGDTRETSLLPIVRAGGHIYAARRRIKWPGVAAVVVSAVSVSRSDPGHISTCALLDGKAVDRISALLFRGYQDANPERLTVNASLSHHGVDPSGPGFTFDDQADGAHPISTMQSILAELPDYAERIFPYIGGAEVNSTPNQEHHRYIIQLGGLSLKEARERYPRLVSLVESSVKPDRESRPSNNQARYLVERWWLWHSERPQLQEALKKLPRVLVNCQVGPQMAFAFQPSDRQFALTLNVFTLDCWSSFAILQSRIHEVWARYFGSSMKDDLRYTTSDCFDTFPFPQSVLTTSTESPEGKPAILEAIGREYYEYRAALMARNREGLTTTYNRFHDPEETSPDILRLRELHANMDRAVLDAYGWTDIQPTCEFLLDYEGNEEEEQGKKKKPWRYRWPDDVCDEVLARLLKLNAERAEEERLAGILAAAKDGKRAGWKQGVSRRKGAADDLKLL